MTSQHSDKRLSGIAEATRLVRSGQLLEATALIQQTLGHGHSGHTTTDATWSGRTASERTHRLIDIEPESVGLRHNSPPPAAERHSARTDQAASSPSAMAGISATLKNAFGLLCDQAAMRPDKINLGLPPRYTTIPEHELVPAGGRFLTETYTSPLGTRDYKLYIPSGCSGQALPLLVMLHGCTQTPDDFAIGTRMNQLAEEYGCLVVYPMQPASANLSKCWNWFKVTDQQRGRGEPALLAGIIQQVLNRYALDKQRVYIAGLSAGGAMAAVMAAAYPEFFAAVGVHSGLACGSANDLPSALAAMNQGRDTLSRSVATGSGMATFIPLIVFHGDRDTIVNPRNGNQVIDQATQALNAIIPELQINTENGQVPGGHAYTQTRHDDGAGVTQLEHWLIHGAGHAWAGGSRYGSYTDPQGPDATREMLRFFFTHRQTRC